MPLGIGNNLSSMFARNQLNRVSKDQSLSLQKLSSGFKINNAKDGPAGLVISEMLRSQLSSLQRSVQNTQEAHNNLAIAEGGLGQISDMLRNARGLAIASLNTGVTSSSQISANQAELNGLFGAISNLAGTTSFAGQNLINGAQEISFTASDPDNILNTGATRINLISGDPNNVNLQFAGGTGNQAEKAFVESQVVAGGNLTEDVSFMVKGAVGEQSFSFATGTSIADIATAINNSADQTGVNAFSIQGDTQLRLTSTEYGADANVELAQNTGTTFAAAGQKVTDTGQNATVNVKGMEMQTDGLSLDVANSAFTGKLSFAQGDTANTTIAQTGYDQDTLTDAAAPRNAELGNIRGGIQLQLGGGAEAQSRQIFGLNSANPTSLGKVMVNGQNLSLQNVTSGGLASLANDPAAALQVIDQAIADVSGERARIGAYQANNLQTNINSLQVAVENVTATESNIRDTNIAEEMTNFVRQQIMQKVGMINIQSANTNAANVLKLLGAG